MCVRVCMYVCMCVRVSEFLAQQARIRAATLVRALGMCVCECMYVGCMYVCVCVPCPASQDPCSHAGSSPGCVCVCVHVCMCVCVCVYVCVYPAQQAGIRAATLVWALGVHVRGRVCVRVYVRLCMYARIPPSGPDFVQPH